MSYEPRVERSQRAPRLPPEQRRAQLLTCALRVFARRGLGAGRHAEVAAEAGVSVPTVFVYFENRPALVEAVLGEVQRFYLELGRRVHAVPRSAPAAILAHAREFAASVDSHPDHARVWLAWSNAVRDEIWPRYLAFEQEIVDLLATTLERGQGEGSISPEIAPEDGARISIGAAHMIARMKFSARPESEVERFMGSVVGSLAGGLAA